MIGQLIHIPRRALKVVVYTVLGAAVLFVALTRTQVGRDGLRVEVERQFAERFEGRLEIGVLKGNLVNDLFAGQVRLYDATGHPVVVIDSVIVEPDWADLFSRQVSLGTVTVQRPRVSLRVDSAGTWNLATALRRRTPQSPDADPWAFSGADIRILDGRVTSTNDGAPPPLVARGQVFDYTNAALGDVQADLTLEWGLGRLLVDVQRLTARSDDLDLTLESLSGQLVRDVDELAVNQLDVRLGSSTLTLTASASPLRVWTRDALAEAVFDLDLESARLAWSELRRLVPAVPLADGIAATVQVKGPLDGLVLEVLDLRRGQSRLAAEGTVLGLPDSLDFEVDWNRTRLVPADVRAVWPQAPMEWVRRIGRTEVRMLTQGVVSWREGSLAYRGRADGTVRSETGSVLGTLDLTQVPDSALTYAIDLQTEHLDLGRLLNRPAVHSDVNGRVQVAGAGVDPEQLVGQSSLSLGPSRLGGRRLDTLQVEMRARAGQYTASGFVTQGGSALYSSTSLAWNPAYPSYASQVRLENLDLGSLLLDDSLQTRLNAVLDVRGGGRTWATMQGQATLAMDTSTVAVPGVERMIPPHQTALVVEGQGVAGPRIRVEGDVVEASVEGDVAPEALAGLARLWGHALRETIRREVSKPYPKHAALQPDTTAAESSVRAGWQAEAEQRRLAALQHLERVRLDRPLRLNAEARLLRSDILSAMLPLWPMLRTDLSASVAVTSTADSLTVTGTFAADSLGIGPSLQLDSLEGDWSVASRWKPDGPPRLRGAATIQAATLHLGEQTLVAPSAAVALDEVGGTVRVDSEPNQRGVVVRARADLDLLPDRNRLTLTELLIGAESYTWTTPEPGWIDLYEGAAVLGDIALTAPSTLTDEAQRLRLYGAVSAVPLDTAYAEVDDLGLRQVSAFAGLRRPIGGLLNGRVALTGGLRQPTLSGDLGVGALALDDRLLGQFRASSRLLPEGGIALNVHLRPLPADTAASIVQRSSFLTRGEDNELRLSGTMQFPRFEAGMMIDEGALDLDLTAGRIDPFFFDLLFDIVEDAQGRIAGAGTIGGTFQRPVFDAQMRLEDGRMQIPRFNLRYDLAGGIDVTEEGFVLRDVRVTDPAGGQAVIDGRILFNEYEFFSFDLAGRLDGLQIMNVQRSGELPFYGRIAASGDATLEGPTYNARLQSLNARTTPDSEIFIPVIESAEVMDAGYIIFADSTGRLPDLAELTRRANILAQRPAGERAFVDGLEMDLNIQAPRTSTVHLVIDPLLGDVINAVGGGRIQLQRQEGEFLTYGTLEVVAGDYLFTAGEVFVRRFLIEDGTITWDGDPTNPELDIQAAYRTRASRAGLPGEVGNSPGLIPLVVQLHITGRTESPVVDLSLAIDRSDRDVIRGYEGLEAVLNQPERSTEYATSVLLTNSFLLTTDLASGAAGQTGERLAFNSLSQLVGNQLNRYINQAVPNLDVNLGLQTGATNEDLGLTYGVALRLLDERLIIRGQGVVDNNQQEARQQAFTVEVRLSPRVSVEVFYRREGDAFTFDEGTSTTGAGISYQTIFSTWRQFFQRVFGWVGGSREDEETPEQDPPPTDEPVVENRPPGAAP